MRGWAMPNFDLKSCTRISIVRVSSGATMASATARNARWVVASATRSIGLPPTSSMTTCAVPVL